MCYFRNMQFIRQTKVEKKPEFESKTLCQNSYHYQLAIYYFPLNCCFSAFTGLFLHKFAPFKGHNNLAS